MPNPKVGTVTMDVASAVKDIKAGQVEFRVDKQGNLHAPVGRISFNVDQLAENIRSFVDSVQRLKPSASKGSTCASAVSAPQWAWTARKSIKFC